MAIIMANGSTVRWNSALWVICALQTVFKIGVKREFWILFWYFFIQMKKYQNQSVSYLVRRIPGHTDETTWGKPSGAREVFLGVLLLLLSKHLYCLRLLLHVMMVAQIARRKVDQMLMDKSWREWKRTNTIYSSFT